MDTVMAKDKKGHTSGLAMRIFIVAYATASYFIGVAGLAVCILAMADVIPLGGVLDLKGSTILSILLNIFLIILFGVQHSVMARPAFKKRLTRLVPSALERSTFVWTSGLVLAVVVLFWQPLGGQLWQLSGLPGYLAWSGFVFGWGYLLASTFAINHWDLFGLRQAWLAFLGDSYTEVEFKEHWMYRYSRHPIMLGVLIGVWCIPAMNMTKLMLSISLTIYIFIGLYFEERDLVRQWGKAYVQYRERVKTFVTF